PSGKLSRSLRPAANPVTRRPAPLSEHAPRVSRSLRGREQKQYCAPKPAEAGAGTLARVQVGKSASRAATIPPADQAERVRLALARITAGAAAQPMTRDTLTPSRGSKYPAYCRRGTARAPAC